jgi:hypothetical protein
MMSAAFNPVSPADDPELASFLHRWARAIVTNDVEQMAPFTTTDWVLIDKPGVITRDAFHAVVANGVLRHTSMVHDVLSISRFESVAVVRTRGRTTGVFQGTTIEADEWTTNILVGGRDGWRCSLTQLTARAKVNSAR